MTNNHTFFFADGVKCNTSGELDAYLLGSLPDPIAIAKNESSHFYKGTMPPERDGVFILKSGKYSRYLSGQWRQPHSDALSAIKETNLDTFPSPQFRIKPHHQWKRIRGDGQGFA